MGFLRHDARNKAGPLCFFRAVALKAGESWRYEPPAGHSVLWLAMGKGWVRAPDVLQRGEIVVFEPGPAAVTFTALEHAEFVIGSAVPHPHDLVLGHYSVHSSAEALAAGEAQIRAIRHNLIEQGRL